MHPVEDAKGQTDVHNGSPHWVAIELEFPLIIKLWPGSKCWHDPELFGEKRQKRTTQQEKRKFDNV